MRPTAEALASPVARAISAPVSPVLAGPEVDAPYDVVFADPPYATSGDRVAADLRALLDGGWVAGGAVVVVERPTRSGPVTWPEGLVEERVRTYGETALWSARAAGPD